MENTRKKFNTCQNTSRGVFLRKNYPAVTYIAKGYQHIERGNYLEAELILRAALEMYPHNEELKILAADFKKSVEKNKLEVKDNRTFSNKYFFPTVGTLISSTLFFTICSTQLINNTTLIEPKKKTKTIFYTDSEFINRDQESEYIFDNNTNNNQEALKSNVADTEILPMPINISENTLDTPSNDTLYDKKSPDAEEKDLERKPKSNTSSEIIEVIPSEENTEKKTSHSLDNIDTLLNANEYQSALVLAEKYLEQSPLNPDYLSAKLLLICTECAYLTSNYKKALGYAAKTSSMLDVLNKENQSNENYTKMLDKCNMLILKIKNVLEE